MHVAVLNTSAKSASNYNMDNFDDDYSDVSPRKWHKDRKTVFCLLVMVRLN